MSSLVTSPVRSVFGKITRSGLETRRSRPPASRVVASVVAMTGSSTASGHEPSWPAATARRQHVGALVGRGAVGVDDEVDIAVVDRLCRGSGRDMDQAADSHVLAPWRLAQVHRQGSLGARRILFLVGVNATPAFAGARLVAPEVGARVEKPGKLGQLGGVASRLIRCVRTSCPRDLLGGNYAIRHGQSLERSVSTRLAL